MRRGAMLAVVMLLVALGALTSVGVLFRSNAEAGVVSASGRTARVRALARSGLEGVMRELESQRMRLFAGEEPFLTDELTLDQPGGRVGVIRVVRVRGLVATPEGAKLNINEVDAETLGRLELVGPDLAAAIVAGRPFASVDDLLRVDGVTPGLLHGDLAALAAGSLSDDEAEVSGDFGPACLRDVLTVFGDWPVIQLGVGDQGTRFAGERKINLNAVWSEELGEAVSRRYSQEIADGVKGLMEGGATFKSERDIAGVMVRLGTPPEQWAEILDSFCTTDAPVAPGRVDVSRASAAVLGALEGLDASSAAAVVATSDSVDPGELLSVAWPMTGGAISAEALAACVDAISASSAQWRVTIEAGLLPRGADADGDDEDAQPLENRLVLEAVIDLSMPRARLAELTDITHRGLIARWRAESAGEESGGVDEERGEPVDTLPIEPTVPSGEPVADAEADDEPAQPAARRVGRYRVTGASDQDGSDEEHE